MKHGDITTIEEAQDYGAELVESMQTYIDVPVTHPLYEYVRQAFNQAMIDAGLDDMTV